MIEARTMRTAEPAYKSEGGGGASSLVVMWWAQSCPWLEYG